MKKILILLTTITLLSFNLKQNTIDILGKWYGEDKQGITGAITFDKQGYAVIQTKGMVIGGKEFIMDGKKGSMIYKINTKKTPVEIDFVITKLESGDQLMLKCIAEFKNKETMKIAMSFDSIRPLDFDTNSMELKKIK